MAKNEKQRRLKTPLEKALGDIQVAYALAFISAALSVLLFGLSLLGFTPLGAQGIGTIIIAAFVAGLGVGILKKSRICAILLFALFCVDKILIIMDNPGNISSMVVSVIIWGAAYLGGIRGTFNYHKLKNEPNQNIQPNQPNTLESVEK